MLPPEMRRVDFLEGSTLRCYFGSSQSFGMGWNTLKWLARLASLISELRFFCTFCHWFLFVCFKSALWEFFLVLGPRAWFALGSKLCKLAMVPVRVSSILCVWEIVWVYHTCTHDLYSVLFLFLLALPIFSCCSSGPVPLGECFSRYLQLGEMSADKIEATAQAVGWRLSPFLEWMVGACWCYKMIFKKNI